ncbi:hypothetical protein ABIB73_005247 [Bradyrhizobium sp. F1.4.3]|uniref:hypothetical protein n=1 Tax=Bradyrhizobium sp. F1.4.3 TaxID=3156356 RepID=UPI003396E0C7
MDADVVVLTLLNGAVAALFGWYSSYSFSKQSNARAPEVTASFFRLNDYVRSRTLDSYRKAFSLLIALGVFGPLEVLAFSPHITVATNTYLLKRLTELVGTGNSGFITTLNGALPQFALPFVTGIAGLCLLFPQVKFCLSKCRDAIQRMVDFKGNAQRLVDEVHVQLSSLSQREIEKKLEQSFNRRLAPRPRELSGDEQYLTKYQLLYYASLKAPTIGLDRSLNHILNLFEVEYRVHSKIQFFDFNQVTIGIVLYSIFAWLYISYVPHCTFVATLLDPHLTVPVTWPTDVKYSLTIEVISYSLQIAATLVYGLAFYELNHLDETSGEARKRLIRRTVAAQLIMGIFVGLAFHLITVWRAKSGDSPPARPFEYLDPGLLFQAVFPSVISPALLSLWAYFSGTRIPKVIVAIAMMLLGGALLAFNQFTYELNHPADVPGEYYMHEFVMGFSLVLVCLLIRRLGTWSGDISTTALEDEAETAIAT